MISFFFAVIIPFGCFLYVWLGFLFQGGQHPTMTIFYFAAVAKQRNFFATEASTFVYFLFLAHAWRIKISPALSFRAKEARPPPKNKVIISHKVAAWLEAKKGFFFPPITDAPFARNRPGPHSEQTMPIHTIYAMDRESTLEHTPSISLSPFCTRRKSGEEFAHLLLMS